MSALHPATLLICWVVAVVALQCVMPFIEVSAMIVAIALVCTPAQMYRLLLRVRWLILSMCILFVWMTPGLLVPGVLGQLGMTIDGLDAAMDHVLRLTAILGMLALLMRRLDFESIVAGLFVLMKPLTVFRIDRQRIALRLMLTLSYATLQERRDWPSLMSRDGAEDDVATVYLMCPSWSTSDFAVLAGIGGMVLAGFLRS